MKNYQSYPRRYTLSLFFVLTFGWSWLFLIPAALSGLRANDFPVLILLVLGGVGPMISAIMLVYLALDKEGRLDYWRRLFSPSRIGLKWYAVILLMAPVLTYLSTLVDHFLGGPGIKLEAGAQSIDNPLGVFPFILFILLFGPLPEEMGWRGYALDGLQARWNALYSSLILGVFWALWHLPLFFIDGTFQFNLGVATLSFWVYMLSIIPLSIIMTWIYNNNHRSTLSAVLFHFSINFTGELFELSRSAELILFGMWIITAVMIIAIWGPNRLVRGDERVSSKMTRVRMSA